ncbi:MAG: Rrf2 family transcriptional regulator [Lachnospiraceae bacterium]|nr:Rrf2 family transcriptional regulator [Lachnospiraceae bacterium]
MKYSTRLSDAVHILVFIQQSNSATVTSSDIAASIYTNPSYVRQIMAQLKAAGILLSSRGQATPELAKPASEITLLEIYKAVEKEKPLLHLDTHTNPECGVGVNIQLALADYYAKIQKDAEHSMKKITLQDIITSYLQRIPQL